MNKTTDTLLLIAALLFTGCAPENLYLKKIKLRDGELLWYYHSLITSNTPDWVVVKYSNSTQDTICHASNIGDLFMLGFDTIAIDFSGPPRKYSESTPVKSKIGNYHVKILNYGFNWRPAPFKDSN